MYIHVHTHSLSLSDSHSSLRAILVHLFLIHPHPNSGSLYNSSSNFIQFPTPGSRNGNGKSTWSKTNSKTEKFLNSQG